MAQIKHILQWIDSWAPFRFAESWDNCGLQIGNPEALVSRIMVALDPGSSVLDEARDLGCQCLVTHHPLFFRPINAVLTNSWPGTIILKSLACGINIIAAHTNLDAARVGTNAQLERLLDLNSVEPLEAEPRLVGDERYMGIGLVGSLPRTMSVQSLIALLARGLGDAHIRAAGDTAKQISRVAVCTGSGGSLIGKVLASGADAFVTGDMKYHDGKLAEENGLAIIDIGHFASEKLILEPLSSFLRATSGTEQTELEVFISKSERDPFRVIDEKC
jgi:dinuclear metal center YbgI/SA1388 family protein